MQNVKNILLVRLNHIGDLFITLPAIFCLKNKFPDAKITVVTGIWNKGIVEFQKQLFDNAYYYNVTRNCRAKNQKLSFSQRIKILKELKKNRYDLCADFDGSWGFLFFYLFSSIKYLSTAEYLRFNQNLMQLGISKNRYNYDVNNNHESNNIFEVVKQFGVVDGRGSFKLKINDETVKVVESYFNSIKKGKKIAAIHPAASKKEKMLPPEGIAALCDYLIEQKNHSVLFFGSKEDNTYINEIISKTAHNAEISVQTSFNLGEFITAVPYCDCFICLDSIAQHIAQFYEIPALIIYIVNNSAMWAKQSARWTRPKQNVKPVILKEKTDYAKALDAAKDFF